MTSIASQITSLTVVYSIFYSDADQRKHQSSASLAFVWGIHRDRWIPRTKGQLRGKCFHLMTSSWYSYVNAYVDFICFALLQKMACIKRQRRYLVFILCVCQISPVPFVINVIFKRGYRSFWVCPVIDDPLTLPWITSHRELGKIV